MYDIVAIATIARGKFEGKSFDDEAYMMFLRAKLGRAKLDELIIGFIGEISGEKCLVRKRLMHRWYFVTFIKLFHHQTFELYGMYPRVCTYIDI